MPTNTGTILFIDDEANNLSSFKAAFRRKWKILTTTRSEEAFDMLSKIEVSIVVADQRMPGITGSEFLAEVRTKYPDTIRILLTGYADITAVIDAINDGEIYRYFQKPWNEELLTEAFTHCMEVYKGRKEITEKNDALLKSHNELESFVYSASHDLRAPLVSILGVIKLARAQKEKGTTPFDYLDLIENSVYNLDKFVKNIINYYQNRKQETNLREIDLEILVEEVYANFRHYDGAEKIRFLAEIPENSTIYSDELRIKIILNNLVSNAIKYHEPSREEKFVKVICTQEPDNFSITVQDNGKGISDGQKDKVFDMFFTGTNGKSIGIGIGLHIVKEAIAKLDGTISLQSTEGAGSKFIIKAPVKKDESIN